MAQQPPEPTAAHHGFRNLGLRLRSVAIFAPPVFAAVYFGTPWFDFMIAATAMVMVWEWARMCSDGAFSLVGWAMEAGIAVCLLALYLSDPLVSLVAAAIAAVLVGMFAALRRHESPARMALGAALVGFFCLAFLWLRALPGSGLDMVIWVVLAVWFTDAGGYFFGRTIGGPKLAPRISPNKTWAGLGGGILLAAIWSGIWLSWRGGHDVVPVIAAAVCIAVLAQLGDLSVSSVKRRFGVKDTSGLIPGHGGVLDRLDGMLLTGPAVAFVLVLSGKGWI
jgi:phosphatidate cytidylyltransferase